MNTGPRTIPRPAVFLSSSDSRYDVLRCTLPAVLKFWANCPYTFYVGMNTRRELIARVTPVLAPASSWQGEFALQLAQIPETHIIVLMDQYLLCSPVDQPRLTQVVRNAVSLNLPYLRLMPLRQQRPTQLQSDLHRIPPSHPAYCRLQATIWRKSHLESLLAKAQSLWDFERRSIPEAEHCALTHSPPIQYRQVIEQDRWRPDASLLLRRAGLPAHLGDRPVWPKSKYFRLWLDRIRATLFDAPPAADQAPARVQIP